MEKRKGELNEDWGTIFQQKAPISVPENLAFILECRDNSCNYTARWSIKPNEINSGLCRIWSGERKIKFQLEPSSKKEKSKKVNIYLDVDESSKQWRKAYASARAFYYGNKEAGGLSMLQSHLQKCVRRGHGMLAAQSARELAAIRCGLEMLLRRFPIIIIEDVFPLSDIFAPSVWFMLAVTGEAVTKEEQEYTLTQADFSFILGAIVTASRYPHKAHYSSTFLRQFPPLSDPSLYTLQLSLLTRAAYGGMHGDVKLLLKAAADKNYLTIGSKTRLQISPVRLESLSRLRPEDWLLPGVDFHVSKGKILELMMRKTDDQGKGYVDSEDLKSWMWRERSSINFRSDIALYDDNLDDEDERREKKRQRTFTYDPSFLRFHVLADKSATDMINKAYIQPTHS